MKFLRILPTVILTGTITMGSMNAFQPTFIRLWSVAGVGIPFNGKYPLYYQHKMGMEPADLESYKAAAATAVKTASQDES